MLVPTAAVAAFADDWLEGAIGNGNIAVAALAVLAVAFAALGYYFLKGVIAHIVVNRHEGRRPVGIAEVAKRLPYMTMIAVDFVVAAGVGIGLELLLVPGIWFGTVFGLAPILVEVERLGVRDSMRRSRHLVRGNFWTVATIMALALGGVALLSLPLKELGALIFPGGAGDPFQEGFGLLLAGILVKPIAAVTAIELTIRLIAQKGAAPGLRD